MRILVVTPYHAPAYAFGGPVRMAETMIEAFLAAGHEVTVATTDALDLDRRVPAGAGDLPPGCRVLRFPNVHHGLAARAMGWTPRGYRRWVRGHVAEFDVVHLHDVYSVLSVAAARAAGAAGVPYALQPFGSLAPTAERGRPLIKRAFLALWGRRTLRGAAANVYSTEDERRDFLAAGAPEATLVRLPLPLDLPPPRGEPEATAPTLVSVGRLDPIKGLDRLLDAVALVREHVPAVRLEIVGPGDGYRRRLEAQAARLGLADTVRFHGFVSVEEKVRLLETAHAFCLLSRSEGLPVSALEAMACGTPVVVSPGCHIPEIDGRGGVVVDTEPEPTARAIADLLGDAERRHRLAAGARAFADEFRHERVMPRMIAEFERLAARGRAPGRVTLDGRSGPAEPTAAPTRKDA
jgi:glycosyltransferase involved in cell wall biosynthesis